MQADAHTHTFPVSPPANLGKKLLGNLHEAAILTSSQFTGREIKGGGGGVNTQFMSADDITPIFTVSIRSAEDKYFSVTNHLPVTRRKPLPMISLLLVRPRPRLALTFPS